MRGVGLGRQLSSRAPIRLRVGSVVLPMRDLSSALVSFSHMYRNLINQWVGETWRLPMLWEAGLQSRSRAASGAHKVGERVQMGY